MNTTVRGALRQTRIELRNQLLTPAVATWLMVPLITLAVLFSLQEKHLSGTSINVAQVGIPGLLAANLLTSAINGLAAQTMMDTEDGTLLRAKMVPGAVAAHVLATGLTQAIVSLIPTYVMLGIGAVLLDGVLPTTVTGWVLLIVVTLFAILATLPWGAIAGSYLRSPANMAALALLIYGSLAISGVFYPLSALPSWLQAVGQCLPTYWSGLGLRHALLPSEAVTLEVGQSWRTTQMFLMLGAWAVAGWLAAPAAVKRLTRRQSFTTVAAARDRVLARGY